MGCTACDDRRKTPGFTLAWALLQLDGMKPNESWTIPLHVIEWTTISIGFIMAMVVVLMH